MTRFTSENTDGYSAIALADLNWAFDRVLADNRGQFANDELGRKSWEDAIAERLLAAYDDGKRGAELI